ncbi:MAG: Crp/Fnr family transcriptional regulator [Prevotellaceae bacterium]|nr:Crp/Fnr family transcriptional regulator [Prevotellaceae bacterium]
MNFSKYNAGDILCRQEDACKELLFVLTGTVSVTTTAADATYTMTEFVNAPFLIEVFSMFGLDTRYSGTYTAYTPVSTVSIRKSFVRDVLLKYDIFRLNYINATSYRAKLYRRCQWRALPDTEEGRLKDFILSHTQHPEGEKRLRIKMSTLGNILNISRVGVSHILNEMREEGLLKLQRGQIVVPDAALLQP